MEILQRRLDCHSRICSRNLATTLNGGSTELLHALLIRNRMPWGTRILDYLRFLYTLDWLDRGAAQTSWLSKSHAGHGLTLIIQLRRQMRARSVRRKNGIMGEVEADRESEGWLMISFGWDWLWGALGDRYFLTYSIPSKIIIILLSSSGPFKEID